MSHIESILKGGDLRSVGQNHELVTSIKDQCDFNELFIYLFNKDRLLAMRSADAIEKITKKNPQFLYEHKAEILSLCYYAQHKEFIWHLAQLVPRLPLTIEEIKQVWKILYAWVTDKKNSRIVRVNALQALYDLSQTNPDFWQSFKNLVHSIENENIASINARIKKFKKLNVG